jgi:hypothetical protein
MELIRNIVTSPRVYPWVSDDYSPAPTDWKPIDNAHTKYFAVRNTADVVGLLILIPQSAVCWKVHVCMLPEGYGAPARDAMREMFAWVWHNTPCVRIIGEVPEHHRKAARFAVRSGMKQFAVNPKSWIKNGVLQDLILFGISKPGLEAAA